MRNGEVLIAIVHYMHQWFWLSIYARAGPVFHLDKIVTKSKKFRFQSQGLIVESWKYATDGLEPHEHHLTSFHVVTSGLLFLPTWLGRDYQFGPSHYALGDGQSHFTQSSSYL